MTLDISSSALKILATFIGHEYTVGKGLYQIGFARDLELVRLIDDAYTNTMHAAIGYIFATLTHVLVDGGMEELETCRGALEAGHAAFAYPPGYSCPAQDPSVGRQQLQMDPSCPPELIPMLREAFTPPHPSLLLDGDEVKELKNRLDRVTLPQVERFTVLSAQEKTAAQAQRGLVAISQPSQSARVVWSTASPILLVLHALSRSNMPVLLRHYRTKVFHVLQQLRASVHLCSGLSVSTSNST